LASFFAVYILFDQKQISTAKYQLHIKSQIKNI